MHTKDATAACKLFYLHDGCLPAQVESLVKIFQHLGSLCLILHGYGLAPGNSSTCNPPEDDVIYQSHMTAEKL